jgi:hypothetical protein
MQQPIAPRPEMQPIAPRSATGLQQPIAPRPTGMQQPIAPRPEMQPIAPRSATGLQQPVRSPTGLMSPISGSRLDGRVPTTEEGNAPGGKSAAPRQQQVITQAENKDEEWESLPHLDSTMLAHPGGAPPPPVMPPVVVKKFSPHLRDHGDMPTIRPHDPPPPRLIPSAVVEEPVDHTLAGELPEIGGGSQFEDLPTPVKGTPALNDLGFEPDSEFAEDTNKGDGPRGMPQPGAAGDTSMELSDDDFEDLD